MLSITMVLLLTQYVNTRVLMFSEAFGGVFGINET